VRIVRLDAVGYVIKKRGTTCFMVEPEIYDFLSWVTDVAASLGLAVLPEVHDDYATHERLSAHGFWTYDFVLPGLLLQTFLTGEPGRLARHLDRSPVRQFTTLDCHDGIPIRPDLDGILEPDEMRTLADRVRAGGGNVNRILSESHANGVDVHQLNATYYSTLDCDDDKYVAARAIQLFARGVPQIYYVGLLAGENDHAAAARTAEGRAINRHDFSIEEVEAAVRRPVVQRIADLIRLRNSHAAFDGELSVEMGDRRSITMTWTVNDVSLRLEVDFAAGQAHVVDEGTSARIASWTP
jgi:sucrose phosphorylase